MNPAATTTDVGLMIDEAMRETMVAAVLVRISAAPARVVRVEVVRTLAALVVEAVGQMAIRRRAVAMTVVDPMNRDVARVNSRRVREWAAEGREIKGRRSAAVPKHIPDSFVAPATTVLPKVRTARVHAVGGMCLFPLVVWPSTSWHS
jgi:hypothetical protein